MMRLNRFSVLMNADAIQRSTILPFCQCVKRRVWMCTPAYSKQLPTLASIIGGNINLKYIRSHWNEIMRLAASIKQGVVTASLMLRKLGS